MISLPSYLRMDTLVVILIGHTYSIPRYVNEGPDDYLGTMKLVLIVRNPSIVNVGLKSQRFACCWLSKRPDRLGRSNVCTSRDIQRSYLECHLGSLLYLLPDLLRCDFEDSRRDIRKVPYRWLPR